MPVAVFYNSRLGATECFLLFPRVSMGASTEVLGLELKREQPVLEVLFIFVETLIRLRIASGRHVL